MQDIHSIGGGGGRLFGGGGDRRLRPHHHQNHQALKCPRCDSLNTKFCYYNNYNLSQPRHFCKSCRRYWTKGGVLRNVPVGGGCRKTKRSKPKPNSSDDPPRGRKSNSNSSSESSSLTATTTAAATTTTTVTTTATATTEVASATTSTSASTLLNFPDSRFFNPNLHTSTTNFDPQLIDQSPDGAIFPATGNFTSLMTSSNDSSFLGFNMADISFRLNQHNQSSNQQWPQQEKITSSTVHDDVKMQEITTAFLDQTDQIDLPGLQNRTNSCGLAPLDWQAGGDQGMFDLTGTVDQAYWSQTQWTDGEQSMYLPHNL